MSHKVLACIGSWQMLDSLYAVGSEQYCSMEVFFFWFPSYSLSLPFHFHCEQRNKGPNLH